MRFRRYAVALIVLTRRVMRRTAYIAMTLLAACAEAPVEDGAGCPLGQVMFDGECTATPGNGKFDLPNGAVWDRPYDGAGYDVIIKFFEARQLDLRADLAQLDAVWPTPLQTTALTRFGTPIQLASYGYIHTALDIMRPLPTDSTDVLAPVAGTAFMFDWYGNVGYHGNPYAGVVGIWDPKSKLVFQLMHVEPSPELLAAGTNPIEVTQGQVIGKLALPPIDGDAEGFRHTHLDIIDGAGKRALDPSRYLPYQDHVTPRFGELYVLDATAKKSNKLSTGKLDVVIEASDRDDFSARNFEVNAISYSILVDGVLALSTPKCEFDHLYERVTQESYSSGVLSFIDFGNAAAQRDNKWPMSDLGNPDRTFRYALTQLAVVDGRCTVKKDADGFLELPEAAKSISVRVTAWDPSGNQTTTRRVVRR